MKHLTITSHSPLSLTAEENERIDTNFLKFQQKRLVTENDTLLRYLSHTDAVIEVAADITYRDLVGARFGGNPLSIPFLALSAIAFVRTNDGSFIFQVRDSGDWPQSLELPGGFIRASMHGEDTYTFITRRVARDLNITEHEITHTQLLDLYAFPNILEKMLVFVVTLKLSNQALQSASKNTVLLPPEYTPASHSQHFKIPLHYPSSVIWSEYRNKIK